MFYTRWRKGTRKEAKRSKLESLENRVLLSADPIVTVNTDFGDFKIELFQSVAPLTVANFLSYVNSGAYSDSIFHRTVPGFVLQGGGFTSPTATFTNTSQFSTITTHGTVPNEFNLSNTVGTIAMAKLGNDPNSATDQWFVNLGNNSSNLDNQNGGFTVFGKVLGTGMQIVNQIAAFPTPPNQPSPFDQLPVGPNNQLGRMTSLVEAGNVSQGALTGVPFTSLNPQPVEGAAFNGQVATVFDTGAAAAQFTMSINWGDGSPLDTTSGIATSIAGSPGAFAISGTHTYSEESSSVTPPFNTPVTVTVSDTANGLGPVVINSQADVLDANLSQGNPVAESPTQLFFGGGVNQPTAAAALQSFEAAIGGVNNKATPAPQASGFRTINWDGVKTDGSDAAAGANSTVVIGSKTVGIPLDRFQTNGVYFGAVYAVSGDGFTDVNPSVGANMNPPNGLFKAFSPPNTFAMFNDNGIDFKFVAPSPDNSAIVSASTRGFGAIFLNVEKANTTSIQYFNGNNVIATEFAPVGGKGNAVFVGALFKDQVVTRVVLNLGTDVLFSFDGTKFKAGASADDGVNHNLVVTDDWAFPEPVPTPNGLPIVTGAQGTTHAAVTNTASVGAPFTGVVGTFNDQDPNGNAKDFTATINWGDGHLTNGTIAATGQGGFNVTGTNTFASLGTFPVNVDIADFGGGIGTSGSLPTVSVNNTIQVNAGNQNHRFVAQLFQDVLGRQVDTGALAFFGGALDAKVLSRAQVIIILQGSPEYRLAEVNSLFLSELNRPGDVAGLSFFAGVLAKGMTLEQVKAVVLGSDEFFADSQADKQATANQSFVDNLFLHLQGVHADSGTRLSFAGELDRGAARSMVIGQIAALPDSLNFVVNAYFEQLLHRPADSGGEAFFAAELQHGADDPQVVAGIVGSDEYFARIGS